MRPVEVSDIVRSVAGRDADGIFFVLRIENGFAYLADGRLRRRESPKKKRLKHLRLVTEGVGEAAVKLRRGEIPTNRELKAALRSIGSDPREAESSLLEACSEPREISSESLKFGITPQNVEEGS